MARKPRSELSEAYRRRIERAEARGKTRQEARGHKASEHIVRKESEQQREAAGQTVTSQHKTSIRRYLQRLGFSNNPRRQRQKMTLDEAQKLAEYEIRKRGPEGWTWFENARKARAGLRDASRKGQILKGADTWEVINELYQTNDAEFLLYYHD